MDLGKLFNMVFSLSVMGSILFILIALIKVLFKKRLGANWHYYIWFILIIRLIIPNTPESSLSIFNVLPSSPQSMETSQYISKHFDKNSSLSSTIENISTSQTILKNNSTIENHTASKVNSTNELQKNVNLKKANLLSIIWLLGLIGMLLYLFILNIKFDLKIRKQYECTDEDILRKFGDCIAKLNVTSNISIIYDRSFKTPSIFGLLKPRLLLSDEVINKLSDDEKGYIFLHELAHLKRKDNLINWILLLIQALHWFNPIIWYAFYKMKEDCEVACDAYVLSKINIREHKKYGETIISLINTISKPYCNPITTGMASNKSTLKRRIKMITGFKKSSLKWSILSTVIILAVALIGLTNKTSLSAGANKYKAVTEHKRTDIAKIDIVLDPNGAYWNGPRSISLTDGKMIYDIMSMVEDSKPLTDESKMTKMSGMAGKNNKLLITKTDGSKNEIAFSYDSLYEIGYIESNEKKSEPNYDFFRYIINLNEYTSPDANIDKDILQLFNKFDWSVDYKINTLQEKLPNNLRHKAGEYPTKIYWAYNNELSKQIGVDFSSYLGKDITAEIYRLREPLPDFMKPRRDARGIVLKYDNKIIGAYIDAGRGSSFATSLDRKDLSSITGKDWNKWLEGYTDYNDELEIKLSKMKPEDIIKEYFNALDKQDIKMVWACMTRSSLSQELSMNMDNQYLFNEDTAKIDYNIKNAKLLETKELKALSNEPGVLEYQVTVDFTFKEMITSDDGISPRFIIMKKESDKSGWRIDSIGTGP